MLGLVGVSVIWGSCGVLTKVALSGASAGFVALARVVFGAVVLWPAMRLWGHGLPRGRDWRHLTVLGLALAAVPFSLTAWGQEYVGASQVAVLHATIPLWTALFGVGMLGRRPRRVQSAGLVLGAAGVALVCGLGGPARGAGWLFGAGAVAASAASYGFGYTYLHRHLRHLAPLPVAAGIQLVAAVLLVPLVCGEGAAPPDHGLSAAEWADLVVLGVVGTGFAQLLNYRNIDRLGPTTASLATYLMAPVGVGAGIAVLGEPFSLRLVVGAVLVLGGIALARDRAGRRPVSSVSPRVPRPARRARSSWRTARSSGDSRWNPRAVRR